MKGVSYDILEESEPLNNLCHIRVPHSMSALSDRVFRKLPVDPRTNEITSKTEYYHLDKVFWRCEEQGFKVPDHRLVRDSRDNPWLEVEYIDGVAADDLVDMSNGAADDFLDAYGSVLESILADPREPFNTDQKYEQFMYDGKDFYVCDLEPRVAYLDSDPGFRSPANQRLSGAVNQFFKGVTSLYEDGVTSERTVETAVSLGEKTLAQSKYFEPYPSFDALRSAYDSFTRREL